jgi:2-amino-4-hydroxy-6-hydroxymethyldihydropteridine diphosphokinase
LIANIAIGSNIGDPKGNVKEAIENLSAFGRIVAKSSFYATKPWGVTDQADFCNAAVQIDTNLSARDLLSALKGIETLMGRTATYRWGPRLIDLDLLTYGDAKIDEPDLIVPHPRMNERSFVLVPLAQIDKRFVAARDSLAPEDLNTVHVIPETV